MNTRILGLSRHALAVGLLTLASCVGCATWKANPESTTDNNPWDADFRKPSSPGQMFGVNSESRAIERNLGIR